MEATLTVRAAERTAVQGRGEVTLTVTVTGPAALEVEEPQLGDATAAWEAERRPATRAVADGRAAWEQVIRLKQVKPGVEAPPDVSVRFRAGPDAPWGEARWVDILKQPRDVLPPPAPPAGPSVLRWGLILAGVLVGLLLAAVWVVRRRKGTAAPPLPPEQAALRDIDRIERDVLPPRGDAEAFHTQLSLAVRRYLAERFGLRALQQTTAEFLDAVRGAPGVLAETQALLREFFERCDLAKFARAGTPPEECQRSAALARGLVRETAKVAQLFRVRQFDENTCPPVSGRGWVKSRRLSGRNSL